MIEYGKKYRCGNFYVYKSTKTLSKKEVRRLREDAGIPKEAHKYLDRAALPFVCAETLSGNWKVQFVAGSMVAEMLEYLIGKEDKESIDQMLTLMFSDTFIVGDQKYYEDKSAALHAFMERQKARNEDDGEVLEELRRSEEIKENIVETGKTLSSDGTDGSNKSS